MRIKKVMNLNRLKNKILLIIFPLALTHFIKDVRADWLSESAPKKIITLAPSNAEIVSELLHQNWDTIVGVSEYTQVPEQKKIAIIGPMNRLNYEKILELNPDLILATREGNNKQQIEKLKKLKLNVVTVGSESLEKLKKSFLVIGNSLKIKNEDNQVYKNFDKNFTEIVSMYKKKLKHKKYTIIIAQHPFFVVGGKNFIHDLFLSIGMENVFSSEKERFPQVSFESIIQKKFDFLIINETNPFKKKQIINKMNKIFISNLNKPKIVFIKGDALLRPSQNVLIAFEDLLKNIVSFHNE